MFKSNELQSLNLLQELRAIIKKCLNEAQKRSLVSIAIPALGTGNLGYPRDRVAAASFDEVLAFSKNNPDSTLREVHLVVSDKDAPSVKAFQGELASRKMLSAKGDSYLEIFAGTKQHIDKVIRDIEKDVADRCKLKEIVHDAIGKLSEQQTRKIRDLQAEHDVLVTIEEAIGRISIRGDVEGVLGVATTIYKILNQQREEDYLRGVEELVAQNIQWFFRDDGGSWEPYDTSIN